MLTIVSVDGPRLYPPRVTAFTRRFWEGLQAGRFTTTRCEACGKWSFPPKPFCPHCWSRKVAWAELSGQGRLYAATTIHAAPAVFRGEAPYRVGIVDLWEGVRLATRIWGAASAPLDGAVRLIVLNHADGALFAAQPMPDG